MRLGGKSYRNGEDTLDEKRTRLFASISAEQENGILGPDEADREVKSVLKHLTAA